MNRCFLVFLMGWPLGTWGQLFNERPPYTGSIASATITHYGSKDVVIVDEQGGPTRLNFGHGKTGAKARIEFDGNARMVHRTMSMRSAVVTDEVYRYDTINGKFVTWIDHLKHPFLSGRSTTTLTIDGSGEPMEWVCRNGECALPEVPHEERQFGANYSDGRLRSFEKLRLGAENDTLRHTCLSLSYDSLGRLVSVEENVCGHYTYVEVSKDRTIRNRVTIKPTDPILVTKWTYSYGASELPTTMQVQYLGMEYIELQRGKVISLIFRYDDHGNWTSISEGIDGGQPMIKEKQKIKYR